MAKVGDQDKEAPRMARNPNILLLYQAFVAFLSLALASLGFAMAWTFLYLQDSRDRSRPGINVREL